MGSPQFKDKDPVRCHGLPFHLRSASAVPAGQPGAALVGADRPLGINAKFVRRPFDPASWRSELFRLQASAAKLLKWDRDRELQASGVSPGGPDSRLGYHRTCFCMWGRWAGQVTVVHSERQHRAAYKGLITCGCAPACPVCAAKIAERRRGELAAAVAEVRARGCVTALGSVTISHHQGDELGGKLDEVRDLWRRAKRTRAWGRLVERYGVEVEDRRRLYAVTGFENTWSELNGHHPHLHPLMFLAAGADVQVFERELRDLLYSLRGLPWVTDAAGLRSPEDLDAWEHGCRVTSNDGDVAEYISKWGHDPRWDVDRELAAMHSKRGRGVVSRHYTMRELLSEFADSGDYFYARPWLEYVRAMHGRHLLTWSPGLRDWLQLGDEESDEEIAGDLGDFDCDLVELDDATWRLVRSAGRRGDLLAVADYGVVLAVEWWLDALRVEFGALGGSGPPLADTG